jgi:hypothetical protein
MREILCGFGTSGLYGSCGSGSFVAFGVDGWMVGTFINVVVIRAALCSS